jgi:hypothetical protein
MINDDNPFEDDWRECLGVHYMHVVREVANGISPQHNADTLRGVLIKAGFSESALDELFIRATMRADDLPPDYLPELPSEPRNIFTGVDLPPDDSPPAAPPDDPVAALEEGEATLPEAAAQIESVLVESEQPTRAEPPPIDPDPEPQQLSLF